MRHIAALIILASVAPALAQTTQPASTYPALQKMLASLKAENAALKQYNETLQKRVTELEGQVAALTPKPGSNRAGTAPADPKQIKEVTILQLQAGGDRYAKQFVRLSDCRLLSFSNDQVQYFDSSKGARDRWIAFSVRDSNSDHIGYICADKEKWADIIAANGDRKSADFTLRMSPGPYRAESIVAELVDYKEKP